MFLGYINPHRCKLPENTTDEEFMYPLEYDEYGYLRYSQCERYASPNVTNSTMECDAGWEYSMDGFDAKGTMVMEVGNREQISTFLGFFSQPWPSPEINKQKAITC